MSQKIILGAGFKEIRGLEFCPSAITEGQKQGTAAYQLGNTSSHTITEVKQC